MSARIHDGWTYHGLRVVRLENARLAIDVMPELGGKILRIVDKRGDRDVLWHSPRVEPHRAELHANFDDHWPGGWDEAFPGGAPSPNRYGDQVWFGIVAALFQRTVTGKGQKVTAAMQDGVLNLARVKLRDQQRLAHVPARGGELRAQATPFTARSWARWRADASR